MLQFPKVDENYYKYENDINFEKYFFDMFFKRFNNISFEKSRTKKLRTRKTAQKLNLPRRSTAILALSQQIFPACMCQSPPQTVVEAQLGAAFLPPKESARQNWQFILFYFRAFPFAVEKPR